jgi:oxygen-independent coproporphyrinogen-3 oxidase
MRGAGLGVSADLIVGWPGQTLAGLAEDVAAIVGAGAQHVSVYALTVEAGTPWETLVRRGRRRLPDPDHQADLLLAAEAALTAAGLPHYEVASYGPARAPQPRLLDLARLRRARAVGALGDVRRGWFGAAARQPARGRCVAGGPSAGELEQLDALAAAVEGLWTGLRFLPGVDVAAYLGASPRSTAMDRGTHAPPAGPRQPRARRGRPARGPWALVVARRDRGRLAGVVDAQVHAPHGL